MIMQSCYGHPDPRRSNLFLSLLFIVLAMGIQIGRPDEDFEHETKLANRYYSLARVSVTKFVFDSVSSGSPSQEDLLSATKCLVRAPCDNI